MRSLSRSASWALILLALITCPMVVRSLHEEKTENVIEEAGDDTFDDYEDNEDPMSDYESPGKDSYGPTPGQGGYSHPPPYSGLPPPPPPPPPPAPHPYSNYPPMAAMPPPQHPPPQYQLPEPSYHPPSPPSAYQAQANYTQPPQSPQQPAAAPYSPPQQQMEYQPPNQSYSNMSQSYQQPTASYAAPSPQMEYQPLPQTYSNMSQPSYQQPASPQPTYQAPAPAASPAQSYNNMTQPSYQLQAYAPASPSPQPEYQPQPETYSPPPAPQPSYQPAQSSYPQPATPYMPPTPASQPDYQPTTPAQPPYYQPPPQQQSYSNMTQPSYQQAAPAPSYQPPPMQQQQQPSYSNMSQPTYQQPATSYSPPPQQQSYSNMTQPSYQQAAPAPSYQPPPMQQQQQPSYSNMSQPTYQQTAATYSPPPQQQSYSNMTQPSYQHAAPAPSYQPPPMQQQQPSYSNMSQPTYQQPATSYSPPPQQQSAPATQQASQQTAYRPQPQSSNNMSQSAYQRPLSAPAPAPAPQYQPVPVPQYQPSYMPEQYFEPIVYVPPYQPQAYIAPIEVPTYAPPPSPPSYQPAQAYRPAPASSPAQSYQPAPAPASKPAQTYQPAPASSPAQSYPPAPAPAGQTAQSYRPASPVQAYQPAQPNQPAQPKPQAPSYQQTAPPKYTPPPTTPPKYVAPPKPITGPHYTPPQMPVQRPMPRPYYQPAKPAGNYSAATPAAAPAPVYRPAQPTANYTAGPRPMPQQTYRPPTPAMANYSMVQPMAQAIKSYMANELVSMVTAAGYRANHWTLHYYATAPYRQCPSKGAYLAAPTYKDIQAAFIYAQSRLASSRGTVQYMNASQPSWTARHQIFSWMSQTNAQMDEEGLLLEFVSQYLADRACLTKWDKQRYLPTLTKFVSSSNFPGTHSCSAYYRNDWQARSKYCTQSKYRTIDGFCNNPYHPYWGKSNVCHIRLLSPDYADGISVPRNSYNYQTPLPNPRSVSNYIHNDIPLEGAYNLMKMQWGQFINHDISNTALSTYEGLVDCCKQPNARGCWPIFVPPGDKFYTPLNVTCLNFIRSGVCPLCQLGPRQQLNKNTAYLDLSTVYGSNQETATKLRTFQGGMLRISHSKNGEALPPMAITHDQCTGQCFQAGDSRVNQHPALTVLHTLLLRNHNRIAEKLRRVHPNWNDEYLYQEARRINIAEYQMITYNEYFPIVFGPILSSYYKLTPLRTGYTYYEPKVDASTWNEYTTATCRFGHSQIQSTFGLYSRIYGYGQQSREPTFRLKDWFMRPSLLSDGLVQPIVNGLLARPSASVDPWITSDVRNHLYQTHKEYSGGDLAATNIWRGRDHGLPGYVHYVEYCFNYKVRTWKDLSLFIPYYTLNNLRRLYRTVENIDLFTGGMSERHFPGADIGPTFACVNGIQYYHLKFGDRFYFEHGGQAGSFSPAQLQEVRRSTLARLVCQTAYLQAVPQYAFLPPSQYNPLVNCSQFADANYALF